MQGSDAELLAADGGVLGGQHSGVGGGLVTVGLDLHASGDTGKGFAATGITQSQPSTITPLKNAQTHERSVMWMNLAKISLE